MTSSAPRLDSKWESKLYRSVVGLPFIGIFIWALYSLRANDMHGLGPHFAEMARTRKIQVGSVTIDMLEKFHHIKAIDDLWRLASVAFAPSTLEADPLAWWHMFSFLIDVSLLYSIWLFESTRNFSRGSLIRFPIIFGFPTQVVGIGILAPLYYYCYYIYIPSSTLLKSPEMRSIDTSYARTIFPTVLLLSHIPIFGMYLSPSLETRHLWTWAWQMFPVWIGILGSLLTFLFPFSQQQHRRSQSQRQANIKIIRTTILAFSFISATVWLYTALRSPYTMLEIFFPYPFDKESFSFILVLRRVLQCDQVAAFAGSLLWLGYLVADMKRMGVVRESWLIILGAGVASVVVFGPGAAFALGWLWREEVLWRLDGGEGVKKQ
ncbi:hypothetical protein G7Y89_g9199 [Cudoniella acicularis]|uniref:Uncharacterized protein n=1 Tax=Cudoniella acicularis TaxID=354080 RepID=A0A8H4W248_9HELO|nr:hypothetical protein G7Y89_g9199 [Cudoniella acicularis]